MESKYLKMALTGVSDVPETNYFSSLELRQMLLDSVNEVIMALSKNEYKVISISNKYGCFVDVYTISEIENSKNIIDLIFKAKYEGKVYEFK